MDEAWLAARLASGRSIESIAREAGRSPSTVAYWVNKHGLTSSHADRHRARGGLAREQLEPLVEQGRSIREIAAELQLSATAVRHWLAKYELKTQPSRYLRSSDATAVVRECPQHGWTTCVRTGRDGHFRCGRCNTEAVTERRRRVKEMLVRWSRRESLPCRWPYHPPRTSLAGSTGCITVGGSSMAERAAVNR